MTRSAMPHELILGGQRSGKSRCAESRAADWFARPAHSAVLLATALAFTTMAWAQKYTTATRSALIFSLEPVVAWITSWVLTGETLPVRAKLGAGLILAGILLVETNAGKPASQ